MGVILKFGGTLFVHLVFYDFFRDQLKTRVRDRKLRFLILLLCAAALRLVNSFDSKLINLIFGLPVLAAPVLLIFKDDHRKEAFLLLIGGAVTLADDQGRASLYTGSGKIYDGNPFLYTVLVCTAWTKSLFPRHTV